MTQIKMVDLAAQHQRIHQEIQVAISKVLEETSFINGEIVHEFSSRFAQYIKADYLIPCGNGTDALMVALMALGLKAGDEVIVPSFNYVAAAEVVAILGLIPVFVDVDLQTYNIIPSEIERVLSNKTKAVIAVHLFGQCADLEKIQMICKANKLFLVEDVAQATGAQYTFSNGFSMHAGTIGDIGTTSFFPSKNLGCMGDGGAVFTNNPDLALKLKMICNHGQSVKYQYEMVGVNSRLDSIQAAILDVKLNYLPENLNARKKVAAGYDQFLKDADIIRPYKLLKSTHTYNQYTIQVAGDRNKLQEYLKLLGVPSMIYYPAPLHLQKAYAPFSKSVILPNSEYLSKCVLSLPIHPELDLQQQSFICEKLLVGLKLI
jgi:UDP-2-acetamido-2-deoxy-ribo-hexuluronate aminotransferase